MSESKVVRLRGLETIGDDVVLVTVVHALQAEVLLWLELRRERIEQGQLLVMSIFRVCIITAMDEIEVL